MEDHEPFISAIEAHPDDHTTRLVYADWLDDRDLPAGAYLRTELQLSQLPEGNELAPELRARLRALRSRIEPVWLARFDQPRVMLANPTPFPAAWWAVGLPSVREVDATYQRFAYDTLPPLRYPPFTGAFGWLPRNDRTPTGSSGQADFAAHFGRLTQHLGELGLTVPPDLTRWLTDATVWRIPSCTDCHVKRPWDAAAVAGPAGSRVVPFYIDSQGCITWYLYLTPGGYSAVAASGAFLCSGWAPTARRNPNTPLDNPNLPAEEPHLAFIAPSVEAFLYRWWLENTLWNKLVSSEFEFHDSTPITPSEQAYIDFYRDHSAPPA